MSVTFSADIAHAGWAIACGCGAVNHVTSFVQYDLAVEALVAGAVPKCGDAYCEADLPNIKATYHMDIPTVNVSNINAKHLLPLLGLEIGDLVGSLTANDFYGRVLMALAVNPSDAGVPVTASISEHGMNMVECGRPEGYSEAQLGALENVALFAKQHQATVTWA